jgi:hypothetical protein
MVDSSAGELGRGTPAIGGGDDGIGLPVEGDCGDRDDGKRRELRLDIRILRIAGREAEAMPLGVDHHVDIIRIVE